MEDIKTTFDKIMAQFNDSVTHTAPKRLSFGDAELNSTLLPPHSTGSVAKKRRLSQSGEDCTAMNGNSVDLDGTTSSISSSTSLVPPSPWEFRRTRADLIEAKTRITNLKQEIDHQHKLRIEMETMYEHKVTELIKQCDFSSKKVLELERHMTALRKREQVNKQDALKTQREFTEHRHECEARIDELERKKVEFEDKAREIENSMTNELSEQRRHTEKIEMELELTTDELEKVRSLLDDYKRRASSYDELKVKHEQQQQELEVANSRIKELEHDISSYTDWKEIIQNSQSRLLSIPDMDEELTRLRSSNKKLQELLRNKMILEEQVNVYKTRFEENESARTEAVSLQVKLANAEKEIKQWAKIAQDHCLPNVLVSPLALRARIEQLLEQDLVRATEHKKAKSEAKMMENQVADCKQKCDAYVRNIEELNTALKRHKSFKDRVQRKLLMVSRERDLYRQLLENVDKDMTASSLHSSDMTGADAQLRARVDMLEKTLNGYREMYENLEKEMLSKQQPNADSSKSSEDYEYLKNELETLRMDNDRLRRRKDELELELEHHCLKGDFNIGEYKVLHLDNNPANQAYNSTSETVLKLQAEVTRLKRRIAMLEEDNEQTQARLNDTANVTMNIKELNKARSELETALAKNKKMKECFKSATMEFRDICYMLLGYRVDRVGINMNFKLSSMYAESPNDYLNFRLNEENVLEMLETPYSTSIQPFIERQLMGHRSFPAFLSSLTLDLFQRSTVTDT